mmetsp:Transcript_18381/g.49906  ORF Transcript_18381/g.49906 Transcript_18381/m.49906 type:complete len:233 (-) Transcript_18381:61-759(-)
MPSSGSGAGCAGKPSESKRSLPTKLPPSAGWLAGRGLCRRFSASRMRMCMGQRASMLAWIFRSKSQRGSGSSVWGEAARTVSSVGSLRCAGGTSFSTMPSATKRSSKSWSSLRLSKSATKRRSPCASTQTAASRFPLATKPWLSTQKAALGCSAETHLSSGKKSRATYSSSTHSVQPFSTRTVYSKSCLSAEAQAPTTWPNCSSSLRSRGQFSSLCQSFSMKTPVRFTSIMT